MKQVFQASITCRLDIIGFITMISITTGVIGAGNRYWYNQDWYREHSKQHWAGHEFHRPPPGHPGGVRGLHDKGPRAKQGVVVPQDKGPRGDVKSVDKGPKGKPVVAGYNEKGPRSDAGPGIKGRKYGEDKGTPGKEPGGKGKQGHPSKTD